ncbi:hypothetical protein HPP92_002003 [Vanilla planifolia]|uniref:Pectinesterase inhibitor domain-containing protein n=1 Tax=Vanilla planifolia TaxID=51239 RepID=A0A835S5C8_VANPL|nr:hypothetical protein HPP92_002003 [Vanilla planifolia]
MAVSLIALACVGTVIVRTDILSVGSPTPDDYNANIPRDDRNNADAAYQMRVHSFCGVTDFKDLCVSDISNSTSSHPSRDLQLQETSKSMVIASIQAAIDGIHKTLNHSRSGRFDSLLKQGIDDCDELLGLSVFELEDARWNVNAADVDDLLPVMTADLRDALGAAITFEQTCAESINTAAAASEADAASTAEFLCLLGNASISTRNTLAVISSFTEPMDGFYTLPMHSVEDAEQTKLLPKGKLFMEDKRMAGSNGAGGDAGNWLPPEINKAPDVLVAKDGSGDFRTISDALKRAVAGGDIRGGRFVIYVKKGVYNETVHVTAEMTRVTIYGDGPENTILTGTRSVAGGSTLYSSATFAVTGNAFMALGIRFENRGGAATAAAVALRVESDSRQFYLDCVVSGSADLIYGDASAALQNSLLRVKHAPKGLAAVLMASTRVDWHQSTAISLHNCTILGKGPALWERWWRQWGGRPWRQEPSVGGTEVYFGEFENRGEGACVKGRMRWSGYHEMSAWDARKFAAGEFIQGMWWLNATGVPFDAALF